MWKQIKTFFSPQIKTNLELLKRELSRLEDYTYTINGNEVVLNYCDWALCKIIVTNKGFILKDWSEISLGLKPMEDKSYNFNSFNSCKDFVLPIYQIKPYYKLKDTHLFNEAVTLAKNFSTSFNLPNNNPFILLFQYIRQHRKIQDSNLKEFISLAYKALLTLKLYSTFLYNVELAQGMSDYIINNIVFASSQQEDPYIHLEPQTKSQIIFQAPKQDKTIPVANMPSFINADNNNIPYLVFYDGRYDPSAFKIVSLVDLFQAINKGNLADWSKFLYYSNDHVFDLVYGIGKFDDGFVLDGINVSTDLKLNNIHTELDINQLDALDLDLYHKIYFYFETKKDVNGNCLWKPYVSFIPKLTLNELNTLVMNLIQTKIPNDEQRQTLIDLLINRTPEEIVRITDTANKDTLITLSHKTLTFTLADINALYDTANNLITDKIRILIDLLVKNDEQIATQFKQESINDLCQKYPLLKSIRQFNLNQILNDKDVTRQELEDIEQTPTLEESNTQHITTSKTRL